MGRQYFIQELEGAQAALCSVTKSNAAVLQQVAEVVKQGSLVVTADATKITQEATAAGNHGWEGNFLSKAHEHKEGHNYCFCSTDEHSMMFCSSDTI